MLKLISHALCLQQSLTFKPSSIQVYNQEAYKFPTSLNTEVGLYIFTMVMKVNFAHLVKVKLSIMEDKTSFVLLHMTTPHITIIYAMLAE